MAIIKKKVRGKEIDWDTTLGGPLVQVPPQAGVSSKHAHADDGEPAKVASVRKAARVTIEDAVLPDSDDADGGIIDDSQPELAKLQGR